MEFKKNQFLLFCGNFLLNVLLSEIFIIPFIFLTIYTILCPVENGPFNILTFYCNKHNQNSLSLTTLTSPAVLPALIQLYYLQQL